MSANATAAARPTQASHRRGRNARRRVRVRVEGTVQGVGFRPYVYRLAHELDLGGYVLNDTLGVLLEVEGTRTAVECLLARVQPEAPPLAVIERLEVEPLTPTGESSFAIRASPGGQSIQTHVTPDSATCEDCLRELFDPHDRRHRYPFVNCTNCGPRFTIVRGVPYDRPLTTMAGFRMCTRCHAEYADPADRRFHAQPNACPECGPSLALLAPDGTPIAPPAGTDAAGAAATALRQGKIVAIKGIGGFHLACRADDESAVATLRARKQREDKPFALMLADVAAASRIVTLGELERELLCGPERPIVLAPRRGGAEVAPSVAAGAAELGVMLPYSPLHHLLLADLGGDTVLVMTSGNLSDEPIAFRDEDAIERLGTIADLLLVHDRPIQTRTDDSVVRAVGAPGRRRRVTLRRSRGYVPASLPLPDACERPILACGAELKSTFCLAHGKHAWVSHHIGDLENYETLRSFTDGVAQFERLLAITPGVIAHDLHPEYLSSKYALDRGEGQVIGVQHHHAHLAACLAEHGEQGTAVGAIFDGSGYGPDGTIWGGELLLGDLGDFRRIGTLLPVPLPGGQRAISEPWRMACSWLMAVARDGGADHVELPRTLRPRVAQRTWEQVSRLTSGGPVSPLTSSVGRLFDAAAALCGLRARVSYEGQAAVELEAACDPADHDPYPISLERRGGLIVIDPRPTIAALMRDIGAGVATGLIASRFHAALGHATVRALADAAALHRCETVVLAGGVFQNRRMLESVSFGVASFGLRVLIPERLPIGDGGISYGQATIAARRISRPTVAQP